MGLLKEEEVADKGRDAVQTDLVKGQNGSYPGNKTKKFKLNLMGSNKALIQLQCCENNI